MRTMTTKQPKQPRPGPGRVVHTLPPVPDKRHSLEAPEQAVVMLSVAMPAQSTDGGPEGFARFRNVGG